MVWSGYFAISPPTARFTARYIGWCGHARGGTKTLAPVDRPDDAILVPFNGHNVEAVRQIRHAVRTGERPLCLLVAPAVGEKSLRRIPAHHVENVDCRNFGRRHRQQPELRFQTLSRGRAAADFKASISLGERPKRGHHAGRELALNTIVLRQFAARGDSCRALFHLNGGGNVGLAFAIALVPPGVVRNPLRIAEFGTVKLFRKGENPVRFGLCRGDPGESKNQTDYAHHCSFQSNSASERRT